MFWAQPFERDSAPPSQRAAARAAQFDRRRGVTGQDRRRAPRVQSIPGVVEDATDIILNLKQVPFKLAATAKRSICAPTAGVVTSAP